MNWYPHVTVATVVYQDGRYLLVHEHNDSGLAYNQPAGHLEEHESLEQAALRETFEETGWQVRLIGLLGVHTYRAPSNGVTYVRISFVAEPIAAVEGATLDEGIIEAVWLEYEEIVARQTQLRSPLVLTDINRFRAGNIAPLELVSSVHV